MPFIPQTKYRVLKVAEYRVASGCTPEDIFDHEPNCKGLSRHDMEMLRFRCKTDPHEMLIYVDGACSNNHTTDPTKLRRAGCGWIFKPRVGLGYHGAGTHLEAAGPDGERHEPTCNRAELRAAIGALQYHDWAAEKFHTIVVASDSKHVVNGITEWIRKWAVNGWHTKDGGLVDNIDLWDELLKEINLLDRLGVKVKFWTIPRELNRRADEAAVRAKEAPELPTFGRFKATGS